MKKFDSKFQVVFENKMMIISLNNVLTRKKRSCTYNPEASCSTTMFWAIVFMRSLQQKGKGTVRRKTGHEIYVEKVGLIMLLISARNKHTYILLECVNNEFLEQRNFKLFEKQRKRWSRCKDSRGFNDFFRVLIAKEQWYL